MQYLKEHYLKKNILHHAYAIEGEKESIFPELLDFFETCMSIKTKGNPDFWCGEFETFGIDDGRKLRELQSRKALTVTDFQGAPEDKKIFVIAFHFITKEAQNALLKVFEEPTGGTHFFIITPSPQNLLPTLKSRLVIIPRDYKNTLSRVTEDSLVCGFLSATSAKRADILKSIIEEKDKARAIVFLSNLEQAMRTAISPEKMSKEVVFLFEEIRKCRGYLSDRSPSVKMILEYISLITPEKNY